MVLYTKIENIIEEIKRGSKSLFEVIEGYEKEQDSVTLRIKVITDSFQSKIVEQEEIISNQNREINYQKQQIELLLSKIHLLEHDILGGERK